MVANGDAGVRCPALGDSLTRSLNGILEAEAGTAQVAAAGEDRQPIVETSGLDVAGVGLERQRVDAFLAQTEVAAGEAAQVLDSRHFEPDEISRVMRDPLGVGLREANGDLGREVEVAHGRVASQRRLQAAGAS